MQDWQAWTSVIGLTMDIAGVILITKNWRRIYGDLTRNQLGKLLIELRGELIEIIEDKNRNRKRKAKVDNLSSPRSELEQLRYEYAELKRRIELAAITISTFELAKAGQDEASSKLLALMKTPDTTSEQVAELFDKVLPEIDRSLVHRFSGDWDMTTPGLFLIILGFLLQIIGNLPT